MEKNKGKEKNVPGTGLEPACLLQRQNLNLVSLPISPPGHSTLHFCDHDWIRTSTPFPALPPQSSLSTNFNTWPNVKEDCKDKFFNEYFLYTKSV